jgi:hypothetical protein
MAQMKIAGWQPQRAMTNCRTEVLFTYMYMKSFRLSDVRLNNPLYPSTQPQVWGYRVKTKYNIFTFYPPLLKHRIPAASKAHKKQEEQSLFRGRMKLN